MVKGLVVPLLPRVASTADVRPRDPPDMPGSGALSALFRFLAANKWPTLSRSAQASYRQLVNLSAALGEYPSVGQVAQWVTWLRREYPPPQGCTESWTVHGHWKNLVAVYNDARELGLVIGANPAALLHMKKPRARARAIVGVHELWPTILGACHDLRERTLLQAALDVGGRRAELLGLMPGDLVTTCEPWRLRIERQRKPDLWTATPLLKRDGALRSPPVSPELRAMLSQLIAQGAPRVWIGRGGQELREKPFLFPYRTHELNDLHRRLAAVAPTAFPQGDFLHALRHTFAVELNQAGASFEQVSVALGHKDTATTRQVYVNAFHRPVDAAPFEAVQRARAAGVTSWGAPPGRGAGPPGAAPGGPEKRPPGVAAPGGQRRSKAGSPTVRKESTSCSTPSQKRVKRSESASAATRGTSTWAAGRASAPARPAPARSSGTRAQRALPGLALQRVNRRPRR